MLNHLFCKFARVGLIAVVACGTAVIAANEVSASTKVMPGTHSFGQVAAACGGSGGNFAVTTSGGYSCASGNVDVECNAKGQCTSSCAGKNCPAVSRGLNGVLRPPASAGAASAAGGTGTKSKPPIHSVNQPAVVQHSGGHSGGSKH